MCNRKIFHVSRALFKVSDAPPNIEKTYETGSFFMFPGPFGSKCQIRPKTQMPGKWPVHNPNNPSAQPSGCRCTTPQTIFPNSGPCEPLGAGPKRCSSASSRCFAVSDVFFFNWSAIIALFFSLDCKKTSGN